MLLTSMKNVSKKTLEEISLNLITWLCSYLWEVFSSFLRIHLLFLFDFTVDLKSLFRTSACHPEKNCYPRCIIESLLPKQRGEYSHGILIQFKTVSEIFARYGSPGEAKP